MDLPLQEARISLAEGCKYYDGGSTFDTFYDITGGNTSLVPGYRLTAIGNPDMKSGRKRIAGFWCLTSRFSTADSISYLTYSHASNT
ncbi:MAG: hypothetical protein U5K79_24255, partial [Cyclobacteriaceae bacterium]|nr:hypothetical protein [Cyclobacteriaceae bacterium]